MQVILDPLTGVGPYTYTVTRNAPTVGTAIVQLSNNIFTGLIAGSYEVVVTDAIGCISGIFQTVIIEPTILTATIDPFAVKTNCDIATTVKVIASGGTLPYYYDFGKGYDTVDNITVNNINGTIQTINYTVKDGNGCTTAIQSVNVNPLNKPTDLGFSATPIYCSPITSQTSTVTVTATNGVGILKFEIIEFDGVAPATPTVVTTTGSADPAVFAGLLPGDYLFQVTDANGCAYQELITVDAVVNIAVIGQPVADMTCNTGDDGIVEFQVSSFVGDYSYKVEKDGVAFGTSVANSTLSTIRLTGLASGVYEITVTDNTTLCDKTASAIVGRPTAITYTSVSTTNVNCNNTNSTVTFVGLTGGTGTLSYAIVPAGTTPEPAFATYSSSLTFDTNNTAATFWDIYVKDLNNCFIKIPSVLVTTDPLPAGFTAAVASKCPSATGTYDIVVNDTFGTGMAPYEYSIGSGFQPGTTFTVNVAKAYNLIVKDKFGCTTTFLAAVTILPALGLDATITKLPTCIDNDGIVTASATGGSGDYSYQLGTASSITTPAIFSNVVSGINTILVTDNSTGCTFSITVDLKAATIITGFALSKTEVTCNGGNDGTITATMTTPATGINDNPVYKYTLSGTTTVGGVVVNVGPQDSNLFTGLAAGSYRVDVVSGRGCPADANVTVVQPDQITITAPTVTEFLCTTGTNGARYATITVNRVSGGSNAYTIYEFIKNGTPIAVQRGLSNSYTEGNYAGGTYTINVYDSKGCMGTTTATIAPYVALDEVSVGVANEITCNNPEDITVSVSSIGGTLNNLKFSIQDVIYDASGTASTGTIINTNQTVTIPTVTFTGLPVGNYLITVENLNTGCSIQTVHYVKNPSTFDLTIDSVVHATCFGGTNGSATVTIIDKDISATDPDQAGIFDYTVKNATGAVIVPTTRSTGVSVNLTGLAAGIYTVEATLVNTPYCATTKNFTINQPNAKLTIAQTHTKITCVTGNNDGKISVTATGGWPGDYEFKLTSSNPALNVPYGTQTDFINLTAGTYTITVKDSKGCEDSVTVPLADPTPIAFTATVSTAPLLCFGDTTSSITVATPTGGSGTYLYTLITTFVDGTITANGPQISNSFTNLGAASYEVKVTDTWNCSTVSTIPMVISAPTKVVASLAVKTTQTCETGFTLTLTAAGGTAPYTYSSNGVTYGTPTFNSSVDISFPKGTVGTYNYYVKDANGCVSYISNDIKIDPLEPLLPNLDVLNAVINCKGDNTGVIVAHATGGLGNYIYTLLDGANNVVAAVQSTPGRFDNLPAGFYKVKVESGVDCSVISNVEEIKEPTIGLTYTENRSDITCNGAKNGKITIVGAGGTGQIKYAISPRLNQFFDSGVFENLVPATYQIVIQDANGCYRIHNFQITEPAQLSSSVTSGSIAEEICAGEKNGAFSIDITGGSAPYSVSLDDINGTYSTGSATQTFFDFTGLSGGNHVVFIRDANGCTTDVSAPLKQAVTLNPKAIVQYNCVNNAAANTVTITIDDSITDPSLVDYAIDGGVFQSTSIFTNVAAGFHTVVARHDNGCEQQTLSFEVVQVNPLALILNDGGLNEIVAVTTGGGGNYTYTFNGENYGSTANFIIYKSGNYTVTVTDGNGCTATATKFFTYIDVCIPNNFTPNGDGTNDTWGPGCTVNYKELVYSIFDRYGRKIATYRLGQEWDGTYKGAELPSGDYWYVLKLNDVKDDREFVGHFTLYR